MRFAISPIVRLSLGVCVALGCSRAPEGEAGADSGGKSGSEASVAVAVVGAAAPTISLPALDGSTVVLPGSDPDRAAVLIFGSFS